MRIPIMENYVFPSVLRQQFVYPGSEPFCWKSPVHCKESLCERLRTCFHRAEYFPFEPLVWRIFTIIFLAWTCGVERVMTLILELTPLVGNWPTTTATSTCRKSVSPWGAQRPTSTTYFPGICDNQSQTSQFLPSWSETSRHYSRTGRCVSEWPSPAPKTSKIILLKIQSLVV